MNKRKLLVLSIGAMFLVLPATIVIGHDTINNVVNPTNGLKKVTIYCDNCFVKENKEGATQRKQLTKYVPEKENLSFIFTPSAQIASDVFPYISSFLVDGNPVNSGYYTYVQASGQLDFSATGNASITVKCGTSFSTEFTYLNNETNEDTITIDYNGSLESIDWGDGTTDQLKTHTYNKSNTERTIKVNGEISSIEINSINQNEMPYITSINFGDSITTIRDNSFNNFTNLTSINFGKSVSYIANTSFNNCPNLCYINIDKENENYTSPKNSNVLLEDSTLILAGSKSVIPSEAEEIGSNAFSGSTIRNITIPSNVKTIKSNAFNNCKNLSTVKFTSGIQNINSLAFNNCTNLSNLDFTSFDSSSIAFDMASDAFGTLTNHSLNLPEESQARAFVGQLIPSTYQNCIAEVCAVTIGINIPEDSTNREVSVLYWDTSSNDITIDWGDNSNDGYVFNNHTYSKPGSYTIKVYGTKIDSPCLSDESKSFATNLSFSSSVHNLMQTGGFSYYSNLCSFDAKNASFYNNTLQDYAFSNDSKLTNIELPDNLLTISKYCFNNCFSLISLKIPTSVTSIKQWAFSSCSSLEKIIIPTNSQLNELGSSTFHSCMSLTSVDFSNARNITSLPEGLFWKCSSLTSATFSSNITSLANSVFNGCSSLSNISSFPNVTTIGYTCFAYTKITSFEIGPSCIDISTNNIFLGCDTLESLKVNSANTVYTDLGQNIILKKSDRTLVAMCKSSIIPDDCIIPSDSQNIFICTPEEFTIPKQIIDLPKYAFQNNKNIKKVIIPNTLKTLSLKCFENCVNLREVVFEDGCQLTSLSENCFNGCENLSIINLPSSIKTLLKYCFNGCKNLTKVPVSDGHVFTSIGDYAFAGTGVTKGILFNATLGTNIYSECTNLNEIEIEEGVTTIPASTFNGCKNLVSADLKNIVTVSTSAFNDCKSLETVKFYEGLTTISAKSFYNCAMIEELDFPSTISTIAFSTKDNPFIGCNGLKKISLAGEENAKYKCINGSNYITSKDGTILYLSLVGIPNDSKIINLYSGSVAGLEKNCNINIPAQITTFSYNFIADANLVNNVTVDSENTTFSDCGHNGIFNIKTSGKCLLVRAFRHTTLFEGVTELSANCYSDTDIDNPYLNNLPSTTTKVNSSTFVNSGFKYINLSQFTTTIAKLAFGGSTKLEEFVLPNTSSKDGGTLIPTNYITGCTSLKKCTVLNYDRVQKCENTLGDTPSLKELYLYINPENCDSSKLITTSLNKDLKIFVPLEYYSSWANSYPDWAEHLVII